MRAFRVARRGAVAVVILAGLVACSSDGGGTAVPEPSAARSSPAATSEATPSAAPGPQPADSYTATTSRSTGDTGRVQYDVTLPRIEGGNPAVAAEFNESVAAALQDQIDGPGDERFTLTGREAFARVGGRVVSGLLVTSWNANPPGAHPTPLVATVVVGADDAEPITLSALFPDLQAGLSRLSEESARLLPATAAGAEFEREGIEPTELNFANWLPTPAGMEIHFSDYQVGPHAIGLVVITVPWDRLADVIAPEQLEVVRS
ncbi:RsiV family protein [Rhodococcus sp. UNC363MFTsu5.1]|uniref:RsiV family protein n=1 Tax=Rhodococcus sp. UNC363MFTsu5.1 TaxID=1449069 RepID=UPI000487F142|nr:RsiV family protein [Rhodococcus sp. UNC363MFTsu5.1]